MKPNATATHLEPVTSLAAQTDASVSGQASFPLVTQTHIMDHQSTNRPSSTIESYQRHGEWMINDRR